MLPTSRRDRYDNAKGRRGGILKTLLRKEGRLIRQLIVLLLFAAVALFVFWSLSNTNAPASSTADDTATALPSEDSLSTTNKLSDTAVLKEAEAKPLPSVEAIPRVAFGGKRFLPLAVEEEGFSEERVSQTEGDKSGGEVQSQEGDAGGKDWGRLRRGDLEGDTRKEDLGKTGEAEKEVSEGESGDMQGSVLNAEVLGLAEDPDDGPWTKPAEEKGSGKPRKEAKIEQLADLLHELDEAPKKEDKVHTERAEERSGDGEKAKEGLRGRKVEAGKTSKERDAVEVQESLDGVAEDDQGQDGTRISDTGGLIRKEAEGGGSGAARSGGGELEEDAGLQWKRDENEGDAVVRVIKSPSKEDEPSIGAGKKEEPVGKVIKSPSKVAGSHSAEWEKRRQLVVAAFEDSWGAYRKHAWGHDELRPESRQGEDGLGGLGATIVDALDTAMIMGLGDIVSDAGNWIDRELPGRLAGQGYVNLFETTIRVLGGLLSAYHLSGGGGADLALAGGAVRSQGRGPPPEVYLKRAEDLGERLMSAFSSPTAVPFSDVHLANKEGKPAQFDGGSSSTAEVATLGLEFCYLSKLTNNPRYCDAALGVVKHIQKQHSVDGLVPIFINPHSGHFDGNNIRLGSRGDSYYEYLIKVWMQRGGAESGESSDVRWLREMWDESMAGVKGRLLGSSIPSGLLFVGERPDGLRAELSPKMDHLVCFLAGALALGATKGRTVEEAMSAGDFSDVDKEDLRVAQELTRTCYAMYEVTITGLAPEIAYFNIGGGVHGMPPGNPKSKYLEDIVIQPLDRHNLLRPETVESLFVLYRITGDEQYRQWGWDIFKSLEAHAKVATGGYSSLHDVTKIPAPKRDKMETFFLGETLKYLYLLLSDSDVLPLDRYVFNTEAHPLPVWEADVEKLSRQIDSKHEPKTER